MRISLIIIATMMTVIIVPSVVRVIFNHMFSFLAYLYDECLPIALYFYVPLVERLYSR